MLHLERRLDAVKSGQRLSQVALSVCLILSGLIIISQYNAYFSWYRSFATDNTIDLEDENDVIKRMREGVTEQWLDGRSFRMPFVDIPILPSDIGTLGGTAILIGTVFLLYYSRREHSNIYYLIKDIANEEHDISKRLPVFHLVSSGFVLITLSQPKCPFCRLKWIGKDNCASHKPRVGVEWGASLSILFPAIILFSAVAIDIFSYFYIKSPFRGMTPYEDLDNKITPQFVIDNSIAFALACLALAVLLKVRHYQLLTVSIMNDFISPSDQE